MRIAYIGVKGLPSKGGAERVVEAIVHRLAGRHTLTVYCNTRYTPRDLKIPGVKLVRVPTLPGKYLQPISLLISSTLHAFFLGNYDIIHVHNAESCFVVPLLRLRYRVIATSHGQAYARAKWGKIAKKLMWLSDYFYVWFSNCCTTVAKPLAEEYKRRYKRPMRYLPNGTESDPKLDKEAATNLLRAYGVENGYILFAAGRMDPTKGCHLLLEALPSVQEEIPVVVVGNLNMIPAYGDQLLKLADKRVKFIEFIERKEVLLGIVQEARLFVFPSAVEAMSMMLLEAASLGVPIVCSDIPENKAVLPDQAIYFRSGDVCDLADKLCWALNHPEEMSKLGAQAQAWVRKHLSWDAIVEQYGRLYEMVLSERFCN